MVITNIRSSSPYRITVVTDVAADVTATDYVITRLDNASTAATVSYAFAVDTKTAELVVANEALIDGVVYVVSLPGQSGAPSAQVAYRLPLLQSQVPVSPAEDPEAEAFGVDIDWFADKLTASGDTPVIRGRQCLVNDLAVISMILPGEIFHRPNAGAGLQLNTNAPMTSNQIKQVTGSITREWYKDSRVRQGSVNVTASVLANTGQLIVSGTVIPVAIDEPTVVKLPGGGT